MARELAAIVADDNIRERMLQVGGTATFLAPAQYAKHIADENVKWGRLVKEQRIPLQD
jgi:tripartite-type tricarboxylate transporter receptor subunit TctC